VTDRLVGRLRAGPSQRRIVALTIALLLATSTPVMAEDGASYGARPGPGDGDRSSGTITVSVAAGAAVSDAVEVLNLIGEPATFDVYAADVVATTGGGRAPAARDVAVGGPGAWITVDQPSIEVPGRSGRLVAFTVEPPSSTPKGDYTAAILVEPQSTSDGGTIGTRTRVGLWVEISVREGSDAAPAVPPGPATGMDLPWIPLAGLALIVGAGVLLYVTRERWHRWFEERREEHALLEDFRARRRQRSAATHSRRG
jgi:LPXTG-motif cell wall-anchored protein